MNERRERESCGLPTATYHHALPIVLKFNGCLQGTARTTFAAGAAAAARGAAVGDVLLLCNDGERWGEEGGGRTPTPQTLRYVPLDLAVSATLPRCGQWVGDPVFCLRL